MNKTQKIGRSGRRGLAGASLASVLIVAGAAHAQPAPASPAPSAPAPALPAQPASADAKLAADAKPDALAVELSKQPGGLTLDEVTRIALKTKPSLRAKE